MSKQYKFANIFLKGLIILLLFILCYALWESYFHPQHNVNQYFILSISGISFFMYVLKCSDEIKVKFSLLTLSLLASLYIVEVCLIYIDSKEMKEYRIRPRFELAEYYGLPYDKRSKFQVMMDLRKNDIDAYPFSNYFVSLFKRSKLDSIEIVPLGLISHKTIVFCNESGEHLTYQSDEHGFNNPAGLYNDKNLDMVLVGDSFVIGECVNREENIAGWLTKNGKKVLNLGISNSGPLNHLAILKEYGKPQKPPIVLWFYFEGNDYFELSVEKQSSFLMNYLNRDFSQNLISKQNQIDDLLITFLEKEVAAQKEIKDKNKKLKIRI